MGGAQHQGNSSGRISCAQRTEGGRWNSTAICYSLQSIPLSRCGRTMCARTNVRGGDGRTGVRPYRMRRNNGNARSRRSTSFPPVCALGYLTLRFPVPRAQLAQPENLILNCPPDSSALKGKALRGTKDGKSGAQVCAPTGLYEAGFYAKYNGHRKDTDTSTFHCQLLTAFGQLLDFFPGIRYT